MAVFATILVLVLELALFGEGQKSKVYTGTGVNGSMETRPGNDIVVLGGLLAVHLSAPEDDNKDCGRIIDPSIQRVEAIALATQKINDDPNFLPGVTLAFEIRETCAQTNKALEESLHYISGRNEAAFGQEISGVVGATVSSVSISVARLLRLFKIPQISFASTANVLSDKTIFNYFLRTIPPDSLQARTMADIVEHFNWTYVIAMHTGDIYGTEGIQAFITELQKHNSTKKCIAMSSIELSTDATATDFDAAVEKLNQEWVHNATVVVLFGQLSTAIGILNATRRKHDSDPKFASRNLTWIGGDAWGDRVPEDLQETAQGMLGVIPRSYLSDEFDRYFQSLRPLTNSTNPWFDEFWETFFKCRLTSQSPEGLQECDVANQTISFDSGYQQSGKVTFTIDAVYAFAHAIHRLQEDFCQGRPGLCEKIVDSRFGGVAIRGDLLLQYLHNVSFNGISTEVVSFDENGDQQGGYVIKNLQKTNGKFTYKIVGHWDELPTNRITPLEIFKDNVSIQWSDGQRNSVPKSICSHPCGNGEYPEPIASQAECCWVCKPCAGDNTVSTGTVCQACDRGYIPNDLKTECVLIQPSYLTWSHAWSIVILLLNCIGIIATTNVAIVFIVYHRHQVIKASSRELSAIMLIGIMFCYVLPFFFIAKPAPWICAIRRFGVGFCFALCYSALLVKTNRIHRIFNRSPNSNQVPPLISSQSQLFFTALLVAVQVVIASVWLTIERPDTTYVYKKYSTELKCGESPHTGLPVILVYNFILLLITIYFAFRTRKVPQNFNEAKFINLTVYSLCILWLSFIPTYYATALLGTAYQTGSLVLVIILNATVTLCILFVPKVYYLFFRKQTECQSESFTGLNCVDKTKPVTTLSLMDPSTQLYPISNTVLTTEENVAYGIQANSAATQASNKTTRKDTTDAATQT